MKVANRNNLMSAGSAVSIQPNRDQLNTPEHKNKRNIQTPIQVSSSKHLPIREIPIVIMNNYQPETFNQKIQTE